MGGLLHLVQRNGHERAAAPPSPLLAVTAHPSMANVPTSYYSVWHYTCNCFCAIKGQSNVKQHSSTVGCTKINKDVAKVKMATKWCCYELVAQQIYGSNWEQAQWKVEKMNVCPTLNTGWPTKVSRYRFLNRLYYKTLSYRWQIARKLRTHTV